MHLSLVITMTKLTRIEAANASTTGELRNRKLRGVNAIVMELCVFVRLAHRLDVAFFPHLHSLRYLPR